jgi:hypothetical protein
VCAESQLASEPFTHSTVRRVFVYLVYLDDSDTKSKSDKWQVLTAVVIRDDAFSALELISSLAIADLMPEGKRDAFEEFRACELYGGYGVFEGIEQQKRFDAIRALLQLVRDLPAAIVYGAVNLEYLRKQVYASANPLDIAFRSCASGVQQWVADERLKNYQANSIWSDDLALFIADDCDGKTKAALQQSFRALRQRMRPPSFEAGQLCSVHDDMYFGDSKYSIGIQIADLCSYFIARHLQGDIGIEGFYKMIEQQIVSAKEEPKQ